MKLLIVLFISSMLVLSIGCGSQDNIDEAELVKEVQLLREEVNQLKCHKHLVNPVLSETVSYTNYPYFNNREISMAFRPHDTLCKHDNPYR